MIHVVCPMKHLIIYASLVTALLSAGLAARADEKRDKFDAQFRQAQTLFKEDKLREAYAAVQAAGRLDATRYEASALAALIFLKDGKAAAAREALAEARKLAPRDATQKLDEIAKLIEAAAKGATSPGATTSSGNLNAQAASTSALTGAARRKYDTLLVIVEEADQAKSPAERRKLLDELLVRSGEFVREFPDVLQVWTLRAAAALELEQERVAWEAGSEMIRLGAENSEDPKIRQLLAKLDRKGWLKTPQEMADMKAAEERRIADARAEEERQRDAEKAAQDQWQTMLKTGWENSLGMKFVPVPKTKVIFCIWETRMKDYAEFAKANAGIATHWETTHGEGTSAATHPFHPVANISWREANRFCAWLTQKEQKEGRLPAFLQYRLPTDLEWSATIELENEEGTTAWARDLSKNPNVFPWGNTWPPPPNFGNLGDGYSDGYDKFGERSSVGSFPPNKFGLYDLVGNVSEMCEDIYQGDYTVAISRGSSMRSSIGGFAAREGLSSGYRGRVTGTGSGLLRNLYNVKGVFLDDKNHESGFRVVIAPANQPLSK